MWQKNRLKSQDAWVLVPSCTTSPVCDLRQHPAFGGGGGLDFPTSKWVPSITEAGASWGRTGRQRGINHQSFLSTAAKEPQWQNGLNP